MDDTISRNEVKPVHLAFNFLGAHKDEEGNFSFNVWAPNAIDVSVVGDFNNWDKSSSKLNLNKNTGIWSVTVKNAEVGHRYKFWVLGKDNVPRYKADPFARKSELQPHDASILVDTVEFSWTDQDFWNVTEFDFSATAINIYELHLASWRKAEDGSYLNYREIALELADYLRDMSYTHVLLLPITEYPKDSSFGFETTGYFSPSSRFGDKQDLQFFVNHLHSFGIRVLMNWLLHGFAKNDFGLQNFDGNYCYEGNHNNYNNIVDLQDSDVIPFDYSKPEVTEFLLSGAYYWISEFHLDGLQINHLSQILYTGNENVNNYNLNVNTVRDDALLFIKTFNEMIHNEFSGVMTITVDASELDKTTDNIAAGGLGFDFKWDFGWMKDTLDYFTTPYEDRKSRHNKLTFSMMYNFHERFILALSHREVIDGYGALIHKMPGDYWRQFASLRLLIIYTLCHPGAKLLFMGGEIAQFIEWDYSQSIQWFLLNYDMHKKYHAFVSEVNKFYLQNKELWEVDTTWSGFTWLNSDDAENSVYSWFRQDKEGNILLCVFNMTPNPVDNYKLPVPRRGAYQILLNSDDFDWGGSDYDTLNGITKTNLHKNNEYFGDALYDWKSEEYFKHSLELRKSGVNGVIFSRDIANKTYEQSLKINLPPLAALVLRFVEDDPSKKALTPWPDPELPYPKGFNPYNKAADEGFELIE